MCALVSFRCFFLCKSADFDDPFNVMVGYNKQTRIEIVRHQRTERQENGFDNFHITNVLWKYLSNRISDGRQASQTRLFWSFAFEQTKTEAKRQLIQPISWTIQYTIHIAILSKCAQRFWMRKEHSLALHYIITFSIAHSPKLVYVMHL